MDAYGRTWSSTLSPCGWKGNAQREAHASESRDHERIRFPSSNQKMTYPANQKPQKHVMKASFSRRIGSRAGMQGGRSVEKLASFALIKRRIGGSAPGSFNCQSSILDEICSVYRVQSRSGSTIKATGRITCCD
jgi:hypothetical protein